MTELLRALVCALPLLATGAAYAQKATADTGTTWSRVTVLPAGTTPVAVLAVPATATKPYFLRQTFNFVGGGVGSYSSCYLALEGQGGQPILPLYVGFVADLNVPFKAGEVVSIVCSNSTAHWTFVFSY